MLVGGDPRDRQVDALAHEAAFCRPEDFRRVATRCDKLAANYAATMTPAAVVAFW